MLGGREEGGCAIKWMLVRACAMRNATKQTEDGGGGSRGTGVGRLPTPAGDLVRTGLLWSLDGGLELGRESSTPLG